MRYQSPLHPKTQGKKSQILTLLQSNINRGKKILLPHLLSAQVLGTAHPRSVPAAKHFCSCEYKVKFAAGAWQHLPVSQDVGSPSQALDPSYSPVPQCGSCNRF